MVEWTEMVEWTGIVEWWVPAQRPWAFGSCTSAFPLALGPSIAILIKRGKFESDILFRNLWRLRVVLKT